MREGGREGRSGAEDIQKGKEEGYIHMKEVECERERKERKERRKSRREREGRERRKSKRERRILGEMVTGTTTSLAELYHSLTNRSILWPD